MMTNISELFNDASNKLIEAMKQYIELISVKSSIKRIEIERNYSNRFFDANKNDSLISALELSSKEIEIKSLEHKEKFILDQIIYNVNSSIKSTLMLLENSITEKNDYGVQMSRIMLENNVKFINENKQHISIPINGFMSEIFKVEMLLLRSPYRDNLQLSNTIIQLKSLI